MKLPKQINKLLQTKNSEIVGLITHVRKLDFLNNILLDLLPSPLPLHCRLASIDNHTLIIVTDSSTWSARLRYSIPDLLSKLKHHSQFFIPIKNIEIKIDPKWHSHVEPTGLKPMPISRKSATCLLQTANSIENKTLKDALLHLAENTKNVE